MANGTQSRVFGKRRQQHVLILASGDNIRHMTIRPWMTAFGLCVAGLAIIGYLAATFYIVIRDDLIGATMARQARMQHDYEDRISALRAQLDRITSRQLLDQQVVEQKVEKLMEQQNALFTRHGKLGSLLDRAEESGLGPADASAPRAPSAAGEQRASVEGGVEAIGKLLGKAPSTGTTASSGTSSAALLAFSPLRENLADRADRVFSKVTLSLKDIEKQQLARITNLTAGASQTADAISDILRGTGVDVASAAEETEGGGIGGPYVAPQIGASAFDASLDELDAALSRLESVRETARDLPFGNPAPGHYVTSRFGNRIDPFLGRLALHAGIDFQAATGDPVKATGAGKVVAASPAAGYGNMVEIDHGQGITTRYGHMSQILVAVGDMVKAGDAVGLAGSTGRATGPHVHYEVRRDGNATDPMYFLNAGMKLTTFLR